MYTWDFGDGSSSDESNPVHTYYKFGNYTVTLKAINSNGCADTIIKQNAVAIQPLKITGISGIDKAKQCIPFTTQPEVLLNVPVKISKYYWDFGNGSTSDNAGATAIYTKEGNYTIKVTIETAEGCSASYTLANAVSAGHKPVADFTVSPLMVCAGQSVTLTSTSTNGPIHFLAWNDGGKQPASQNPSLTSFDDTGYMSITLITVIFFIMESVQNSVNRFTSFTL